MNDGEHDDEPDRFWAAGYRHALYFASHLRPDSEL